MSTTSDQANRDDMHEMLTAHEEELAVLLGSLPRHSVKPSQMVRIDELEEEIAALKVQLERADR